MSPSYAFILDHRYRDDTAWSVVIPLSPQLPVEIRLTSLKDSEFREIAHHPTAEASLCPFKSPLSFDSSF